MVLLLLSLLGRRVLRRKTTHMLGLMILHGSRPLLLLLLWTRKLLSSWPHLRRHQLGNVGDLAIGQHGRYVHHLRAPRCLLLLLPPVHPGDGAARCMWKARWQACSRLLLQEWQRAEHGSSGVHGHPAGPRAESHQSAAGGGNHPGGGGGWSRSPRSAPASRPLLLLG